MIIALKIIYFIKYDFELYMKKFLISFSNRNAFILLLYVKVL